MRCEEWGSKVDRRRMSTFGDCPSRPGPSDWGHIGTLAMPWCSRLFLLFDLARTCYRALWPELQSCCFPDMRAEGRRYCDAILN